MVKELKKNPKKVENKLNKSFAFQTSYTTKLNSQAIDQYKEFFTSIGVPSVSKMGCVMDIIHAYPFINSNGVGFTSDVLRNSCMSFLNSLIDINHDKNYVVGSIVKVDLIENETSPLTVRLVGVLDKEILSQWGIEDLIDEDWSMESLYNEYCFAIGNKIYQPSDVPEIDKKINEIASGQAVYDELGNRINLLLGSTNGKVDFNGCGLIIYGRGADPMAETHLQVANDLSNQTQTNNNQEGEKKMSFKVFETEQEYTTAIANAVNDAVTKAVANTKQEVETNLTNTVIAQLKNDNTQLKTDLETATASLSTKDTTITDLTGKLQTAEASLKTETERANTAESKLTEIVVAKQVEDRKTALANLKYECDEEDLKMLATASQTEFDSFVKRIEKAQASMKKAIASQLNTTEDKLSINLTGSDGLDNQVDSKTEQTTKITAF